MIFFSHTLTHDLYTCLTNKMMEMMEGYLGNLFDDVDRGLAGVLGSHTAPEPKDAVLAG